MVSVILATPPPWIILIPISLSRKQNMARGVMMQWHKTGSNFRLNGPQHKQKYEE